MNTPTGIIGPIVAEVGGAVAIFRKYSSYSHELTIMTPAYTDDGTFTPAQSITVYSKQSVVALKEFCDKALALIEETK